MERAGLVSQIVPEEALIETTQALAEILATKSPLGLARMKELGAVAGDATLEDGLRRELLQLCGRFGEVSGARPRRRLRPRGL